MTPLRGGAAEVHAAPADCNSRPLSDDEVVVDDADDPIDANAAARVAFRAAISPSVKPPALLEAAADADADDEFAVEEEEC